MLKSRKVVGLDCQGRTSAKVFQRPSVTEDFLAPLRRYGYRYKRCQLMNKIPILLFDDAERLIVIT